MRPGFPRLRSRRKDGVALVIVLAFLVLISVLVISFFSSVSTELISAKNAAASVTTRQLAESATNLVISQIADGTSGYKDSRDPNSPILAWASQPGMIRTYDDRGSAYRYHKLYSAKNMVIQNIPDGYNVTVEEFRNTDVPMKPDSALSWTENPGLFVDLNAPVRGGSGRFEYPIVNPGAQKSAQTSRDGVEGFEIIEPRGFTGNAGGASRTRPPDNDSYDPSASPEANPAPMPVRWIYVLKDGTLSRAADPDSAGGAIRLGGSPESTPTQANPVVGRIAFWTDDDTAKININTASEGVFWDRPWSKSTQDPTGAGLTEVNFADRIPGQNEFQRYPGHPAMTCLSPVLGFVMPHAGVADKARYYSLVPRIMDGGTRAGSVAASDRAPLVSDNERLFASVDELAFAPQFISGMRNAPAGLPPARIRELLDKSRFFLTASSRAPEVNLFNRPRVGLWPIQFQRSGTTPARNAKDQLIAFCGTTATSGNRKAIYYFQRFNEYVLNSTKVFGDGRIFASAGQPSSTSPISDYRDIPRNQELYAYLQSLTDRDIPGFGGSLKEKYDQGIPAGSSERDQILTSMMDYIRSNVNSYSTAQSMTPQYDYAPTRRGGPVAGETQIVPLVLPNNTKGFGRFATVTEAAVVFFRRTQQRPSQPPLEILHAFLVMEIFNPSPGLASWSPHVRYVVKGLENFRVDGPAFNDVPQDMKWENFRPGPGQGGSAGAYSWNFVTSRVGYSGGGHTMPFMGLWSSFRHFSAAGTDETKRPGITGIEQEYPFYTAGVPIQNPAGSFKLQGGLVQIEIYSGFEACAYPSRPPTPQNLVQVLNFRFPDQPGLPLPLSSGDITFATRLAAGTGGLISANDVVRSVELRHDGMVLGDPRMICGMPTVPESAFAPHYLYTNNSVRMAHSLRSEESRYNGQNGAAITLVPGVSYNREPAAARGVTQATLKWVAKSGGAANALPGDWDNSTGDGEDGAYVNKADEGNLATSQGGYFSRGSFNVENGETFSPNRQIASAVAFGSLPTGVKATELALNGQIAHGRPWQTLLFCANPSARVSPHGFGDTPKHPGFGTIRQHAENTGKYNEPPYLVPPDHLFLDLFTMPIVEPYAISEPLSTAGKVNLNYQIAPFTYIKRATGLHGVLRSTKIMAIPSSSGDKSQSRRYDINPDVGRGLPGGGALDGSQKGTLFHFQDRFERGEIFRSASQICDVPLIPAGTGVTADSIDSFWAQSRRTGDNVREIPYGHIYPRVTTKSNSYTVHMRVQAVRKAPNSEPDEWQEGHDQVIGEYRGSSSIERYIDPADPTLPDFASNPTVNDNLDRHYRFRVIATKAFNP